MIFDKVDFHNIEATYNHKGIDGVLLGRIPESVSNNLSRAGQIMMICPSGSEIRFVSDTYPVKVTLSVDKIMEKIGQGLLTDAHVFFGGFQTRQRFLITQKKTAFEIIMPPNFKEMAEKVASKEPFSFNVCRVRFWGTMMSSPIRFHGIEAKGNIRPPQAHELPKLRYLAYGSSLTQGAYASGPHLSYINLVALKLGADVINLGSCCSAYCEPEIADYIAGRNDWDFATLALSVNMVKEYSPKEFSKRVKYMVNKIAESNRKRPVICITIKPYYGDYLKSEKPDLYRKILRDIVKDYPFNNVYLVEGQQLMPDVAGGLSLDMVHLGDYGMIQIADNLTKKIIPILQSHNLLLCQNDDLRKKFNYDS